jgi:hypothetical protein
MFYGAFDKETAIAESRTNEKLNRLSVGEFTNNKPIMVIDLSKTTNVPGFYSDNNTEIEMVKFLNKFGDLISKPIEKESQEYLNYIPTQVFVEYMRHVAYLKLNIRGIIYKSSKCTKKNNIALFYQNEDCIDKKELENIKDRDCLILENIETMKKKWCVF